MVGIPQFDKGIAYFLVTIFPRFFYGDAQGRRPQTGEGQPGDAAGLGLAAPSADQSQRGRAAGGDDDGATYREEGVASGMAVACHHVH